MRLKKAPPSGYSANHIKHSRFLSAAIHSSS